MRIIINHLTRMEKGYCCVAGLCESSNRHVRPVVSRGKLGTAYLASHQGPFDIGAVVEIGPALASPQTPHVEDHLFRPEHARICGQMEAVAFWKMLCGVARLRFQELFGEKIQKMGSSSYGLPQGKGNASLGCLAPRKRPKLYLVSNDNKTRIRMTLSDAETKIDAPVTDIRLFRADHVTPDAAKVEEIARRLEKSNSIVLSLGLTRGFARSEDAEPVHWLQVNNIHLGEQPL